MPAGSPVRQIRQAVVFTLQAVAFDAVFARDVALPLAAAAYEVMNGLPVALPAGYVQTALIKADDVLLAALSAEHSSVAAMAEDTNIFGLMGQNPITGTAFISFRGSSDVADWLANIRAVPTEYLPLAGFGEVAAGFQAVYETVRSSVAANLATAAADCDDILITGHSLGAAVAVLAAPDIYRAMPPNAIEPRLITFAGPRVGLPDFVAAFNASIESCFRVVNHLDIVPLVPREPFGPYAHVGAGINVDSGGSFDLIRRHSLAAYLAGLNALIGPGASAGGSI
jgi:triacylglycerol lipase